MAAARIGVAADPDAPSYSPARHATFPRIPLDLGGPGANVAELRSRPPIVNRAMICHHGPVSCRNERYRRKVMTVEISGSARTMKYLGLLGAIGATVLAATVAAPAAASVACE